MHRRTRNVTIGLASVGLVLAVAPVAIGQPESRRHVDYGRYLAGFGAPAAEGVVAGPDGPSSFDATLPNGRRVTPAGLSVQVGQNPLNSVLTPDGKFLITSNDDERNAFVTGTSVDPLDTKNGADVSRGQYTLSVTDTATMKLVTSVRAATRSAPANPGSTFNGRTNRDNVAGLFLGLVAVPAATGYTLYASGGVADIVTRYRMSATGTLSSPLQIPVPVAQDKTQATYGMAAPGWLTLSPDGRTLYVVNNNGNSVTPIDLSLATPVAGTPVPVGYFPYAAQLYGDKLFVSNWGVTERRFADGEGTPDANGVRVHVGTPYIGGGSSNLYANPVTDPQKSSSLSVLTLRDGLPQAGGALSLARPIDGVHIVGGTHPSALAVAIGSAGAGNALYVTDTNEDRIAVIDPDTERLVRRVALPRPAGLSTVDESSAHRGGSTFGLQPDALAVSPDQQRLYVAEAGLNAVAVYDIAQPQRPHFLGRIPTGWYPTGVTVSPDGASLYVTNSKGAGSPYRFQGPVPPVTRESNWIFGSAQKIDLASLDLQQSTQAVAQNTVVHRTVDEHLLKTLQQRIDHVVFILRENKTYDTYLGDDAVLNARGADGGGADFTRYGPYVLNTRKLAEQFAVGDNVYADAEESNAGHSFALAGMSTDYMQKTYLQRTARPLTNVKNQDPEDYPLRGYLFNAMARNDKSFRDYGDGLRISGYDEGSATDFCADDPKPGCDNATYDSIQDTTSPTVGLGGQYSETLPALKVLKGHLDERYPGWNLRISDQRRAQEFIADFGELVRQHEAPQFTYLWLPGDHTGACDTSTFDCGPNAEVMDNDKAVGQVIEYLTHSAIWRHTAIFMTEDDGQSSPDHVTPHRTYTTVISPYVKHEAVVHRLSSTVSIPKTIEEILDMPAMGYGDLLANDLLDWFTTKPDYTPYDQVDASAYPPPDQVPVEAQRIWDLSASFTDADFDSGTAEIGELTRLYDESVRLAAQDRGAADYRQRQDALYQAARQVAAADSGD